MSSLKRLIAPVAAVAALVVLSGCVAYDPYPYGSYYAPYGYAPAYAYAPPVVGGVVVGGGCCWGGWGHGWGGGWHGGR